MTQGATIMLSWKRPKLFLPQVMDYKTVMKVWTALDVNSLVTAQYVVITMTFFSFLVRSVWQPASIPCTLKGMWKTTLALQETQKSSMELSLQMLRLMKVSSVLSDTDIDFWSSCRTLHTTVKVHEIFNVMFIFILVATLLFVTGEKAIHHLFSRDTPYELGYAYVLQ